MPSPRPLICWLLNNNNNNNVKSRYLINKQLRRFSSLLSCNKNNRQINSRLLTLSTACKDNTQVTAASVGVESPIISKDDVLGITAHIRSKGQRVTATFRETASDFHVNEIDPDGNIVQLTDLGPPKGDGGLNREERFKNDYCTHCVLYKERAGTVNVINDIARILGIRPGPINYAGMKDKDGFTSQRLSIPNVEADRLIKLSNDSKYFKLGNFSYKLTPVKLGQLQGNHFKILLKDVQIKDFPASSPSAVARVLGEAMKSFGDFGFINYFGIQRFEAAGAPGFVCGKTAMQQNWEELFDLILDPFSKPSRPSHPASIGHRIKVLWAATHDPVHIVKTIGDPMHLLHTMETKLVLGLARHYDGGRGDLVNAYLAIPAVHRSLYLNSFQSFLWNHVATHRITKFGLKPIAGDFVIRKENESDGSSSTDQSFISAGNGDDYGYGGSTDWTKLKLLTDEDVHHVDHDGQPKWSIYDVVLPGVGAKFPKYPNPVTQAFYEKLLKANGLPSNIFSARPSPSSGRTESRRAFYRHLVVKPGHVDHKTLTYAKSDNIDFEKIIPSDLDLLNHQLESKIRVKGNHGDYDDPTVLTNNRNNSDKWIEEDTRIDNKNKICAVLYFTLPSASYATVALREIIDFPLSPVWDNCPISFPSH